MIIVALIFTIATIPALAISDDYQIRPMSDVNSGPYLYKYSNSEYHKFAYTGTSNYNYYVCLLSAQNSNPGPGGNSSQFRIVSEDPSIISNGVNIWNCSSSSPDGSYSGNSTMSGIQLDGYYNGYYYSNAMPYYRGGSINPTISTYSTVQNFIDENLDTTSYNVEFILPAGNAAYIEVSSQYSGYQAFTTMPEYNPIMLDPSASGYNTGDFWPNSTQVDTWASSLPTIGNLVTGSRIRWNKSGDLTILGLTNQAEYESIGPYQASGYQVIINPAYYGGTANGPYEFLANGSLRIVASGIKSVTVYQLNSTMGFTSSLGLSVTTEITDTSWDGEIDPDTGEVTWTDSGGEPGSPSDGGGNLQPVTESVTGWLKNIAQQLADFFEGPIKSINILVTAIRDFTSSIKSLYLWLPTEVYSILVSAITLAITIGVIKVFI